MAQRVAAVILSINFSPQHPEQVIGISRSLQDALLCVEILLPQRAQNVSILGLRRNSGERWHQGAVISVDVNAL
jgi:hypothetical protein